MTKFMYNRAEVPPIRYHVPSPLVGKMMMESLLVFSKLNARRFSSLYWLAVTIFFGVPSSGAPRNGDWISFLPLVLMAFLEVFGPGIAFLAWIYLTDTTFPPLLVGEAAHRLPVVLVVGVRTWVDAATVEVRGVAAVATAGGRRPVVAVAAATAGR